MYVLLKCIYFPLYISRVLTEDGNTGTVQVGDGNVAAIDRSTSSAVTIPESIKYDGRDYSITVIGKKAFASVSYIPKISLPSGVTSIEESAFLGCWNLDNFTIPESITNIGDSAFFGA